MADPVMRDDLVQLFAAHMADLSDQLARGAIQLIDWQIGMRADIRHAHALQLIAGAGGDASKVDPNDWLRLGPMIKKQDRFLENFAHQIANGEINPGAIAPRAAMYSASAQTEYSKQATKDYVFPTYPGEQTCLGNCGCEWIDNGDDTWSWQRSKDDSCADCIRNEQIYRNYVPEAA